MCPPDESAALQVDRTPPEEVFSQLADGTRVEILQALHAFPDGQATFSDLFDAVDVGDSGRFNYHLNQLRDAFVRQVETDDGSAYTLTQAGWQIVGAIHVGTYTTEATVAPWPLSWDCELCGGQWELGYERGAATFQCMDCGDTVEITVPPGAIDDVPKAELPSAVATQWHARATQIVDRVCPHCSGRLEGAWQRPPESGRPAMATFDCQCCEQQLVVSGSTIATLHPITEGFLAEHGYDLTSVHPAQVWGELDEWDVDVRSADPCWLRYRFAVGTDSVTVDLGPAATVTDVTRTRGTE